MQQRPFGPVGRNVSVLSLGTWGLSGDGYGSVSDADRDAVIDRALALGITLFETADTYDTGEMERRLGQRLPDDGSVMIVTKVGTDRDAVPPRKKFDARFVKERFDMSRHRLSRDVVDVVLLHNPSAAALRKGEATGVLEELRQAGKLTAWGASVGSAEAGTAALELGAQVVELQYNALWSREMTGLSEALASRPAAVLARSVLAHGLLTGHWPPTKTFPPGDHRNERWTADELRVRLRQIDALRTLVGGPVMTMRSAALRYVLSSELVTTAVIGPRSIVQIDQLVREAGQGPPYLPDEKLSRLATRLAELGVTS